MLSSCSSLFAGRAATGRKASRKRATRPCFFRLFGWWGSRGDHGRAMPFGLVAFPLFEAVRGHRPFPAKAGKKGGGRPAAYVRLSVLRQSDSTEGTPLHLASLRCRGSRTSTMDKKKSHFEKFGRKSVSLKGKGKARTKKVRAKGKRKDCK